MKTGLYLLQFLLLLLSGMYCATAQTGMAVNGFIDLTSKDLSFESVDLDGEWLFTMNSGNRSLNNIQTLIVPADWKKLPDSLQVAPFGRALYELRVKVNSKNNLLGLMVGHIGSSYMIMIDGKKIGAVGVISDDPAKALPDFCPDIFPISIETIPIDPIDNSRSFTLSIDVSNFDYEKSGIYKSVTLGEYKLLNKNDTARKAVLYLILGIILFVGMHHMFLFLLRREDRSNLFFSLGCLMMVIRFVTSGDRLLVNWIPDLSWLLVAKLEYISAYLLVMVMGIFFNYLFKEEFHRWFMKFHISFGLLTFLLVLLLPMSFYTSHRIYFLIYVIYGFAYVFFVVMPRALKFKRDGAAFITIGILILLIATLNDILVALNVINSIQLAPFGLIAYIISQSYVLSKRNANAHKAMEEMWSEMLKTNDELYKHQHHLEILVNERTEEINQQKEELMAQSEQLSGANILLEKKNLVITDSIQYAQKMQDAILPDNSFIRQKFSDSFIFYKPKDIVSGDFYWLSELNGKLFVAEVDCTGHGVPGGFMSMIANSLLQEIVSERKIDSPAIILDRLHARLIRMFQQKGTNDEIREDGMDISIACFDFEKKQVTLASANQEIYYIVNDQINIIIGDIYSIGEIFSRPKDFSYSNNTVDMKEGMIFYLLSDGFQDQFGGNDNSKYMVKKLREKFLEIHSFPMEKQKSLLSDEFGSWKSAQKQVDDVLIVGVKI